MLAASCFGIVKADGVVVAAMPMLRARDGVSVADDGRRHQQHAARRSRPRERRASRSWMPIETAADDTVMIAFTSGTTGVPKAGFPPTPSGLRHDKRGYGAASFACIHERTMVDQNSASWNLMFRWLRNVDALRTAA